MATNLPRDKPNRLSELYPAKDDKGMLFDRRRIEEICRKLIALDKYVASNGASEWSTEFVVSICDKFINGKMRISWKQLTTIERQYENYVSDMGEMDKDHPSITENLHYRKWKTICGLQ